MPSQLKKLRPIYVPIVNFFYNRFKAAKRYHHLYDEITKNKASSILEVGTWNGRRAKQMIETAQKNGIQRVKYVGFDLFEDLTDDMYLSEISKRPPTRMEVENYLNETGAEVTLVQGNTLQTLPEYAALGEKFDFVFIDGGHDVETVRNDWAAVEKMMHNGTVVIFDDYWRNRPHECAKPIVDNIDPDVYSVEVLPEVDKFDNPDFGRLEISFAKVTQKK